MDPEKVDLVLEGGGVKGIALVGAISVLGERGVPIHRVAGSSAGAIVGSLVAAGMKVETMKDVVDKIPYASFKDPTFLNHFGFVGEGASFLFERGLYKGSAFETWVRKQLASCEVATFDDLRDIDSDPGSSSADPAKAYRLIVTASDLTNRRLALLPTDFFDDYPLTAGDPKGGTRSVAEAVRCSMSIPFFYEPHEIAYVRNGGSTKATMVDGGMLSNFPIDVFDRTDKGESRWPTFGIKLSARPDPKAKPPPIDKTPIGFAKSLVTTMMGFVDRAHIEDPKVVARTIFIDTFGVSATDFDLVAKDGKVREKLYANGRAAMTLFLDGNGTPEHPPWDFDEYKRMMRS